jgi:hypothetical protein
MGDRIMDDPYEGVTANLDFSDLSFKQDVEIQLSMMISTCYRYSQLERSLECLARQDWKNFEVLICADGDPVDLTPIYNKFEPYLHLKTTKREKKEWSVDPTGGFRELMPRCEGEYWAIMQPEMMLYPNVMRLLYEGHQYALTDVTYVKNVIEVSNEVDIQGLMSWVSIKPYFLSRDVMGRVDRLDWHRNLDNIHLCDQYCGFGNQTNEFWGTAAAFPWWFVGSTRKDSPIWSDMPVFRGHAMIDFYLYGYRKHHHYADVVPTKQLAIHQDHIRIAHGVGNEWEGFDKFPVPQEWK